MYTYVAKANTESCGPAVEGLMYLAPACFFWLMAGVAVLEWPAMSANNALQLIVNKPFLYFAAAAMGFCVNLLAYMVIQTASSLTLKVCAAKCFPLVHKVSCPAWVHHC